MSILQTFPTGFIGGKDTLLISSEFGKRYDVVKKGIRNHNGIDIALEVGTYINSPINGTVIKNCVSKTAGLELIIRHYYSVGNYLDIIFMHLNSVDSSCYVGSEVSVGQKIATSGGRAGDKNAGCSRGPHLHLEIRKNGNLALDPKCWFLAKHHLKAVKTGKWLHYKDDTWETFPESTVRTQANYKYSGSSDTTVVNKTEFKEKNSHKAPETDAKERYATGIWQIVKLLIDSSVEQKQVLDSSIASQQGSLLNYFRKVCQSPLVEFMGDTFGNQYYWIVRKPPFDKEGMQKMLELTTIALSSDDIISTNLSWNNSNIYSWYKYLPYGEFLEIKETNLFMPAVFFPEFASIWGSRPLCVESNYYNFNFSGRFNNDKDLNKENSNRIIRNAVADFKYLVESNAYSAFTRRGTITINGDRRIKRGTLILHTSGEVFYVDSVNNTYEVSEHGTTRITTLNVSRGVYPAYIHGKSVNGITKYSYFNIIDFGDTKIENITSDNFKDYISKWKVNPEIFGFFMAKQQVFQENIYSKQKRNE